MTDERPSVDAALAMVRAEAVSLGVEQLPLKLALGRILAEPVSAAVNVPRFVAAAMDGYAVARVDCAAATATHPVTLSIDDVVAAGRWPSPLSANAAAPISTGAPMPERADAIVLREAAQLLDGRLVMTAPPARFANVRKIGEDMAPGRPVALRGTAITADVVGALTASGVDQVVVQRRPTIRLFTTGSELTPGVEGLAGPALILDSNGPMIEAFATGLGLGVEFAGRASDEAAALDGMLRARGCFSEIVISTGGVSHGSFDLVRERLEIAGAKVHFHGVAMRPGKPLLFATLADGRLYFGLPGTPVAALVAMRFFVVAAVRAMTCVPPETGLPLHDGPPARAGTTMFLRGCTTIGNDGNVSFDVSPDQRSHVLSSVVAANAWLRVEAAGSWIYPKVPGQLSLP